MIDRRGEALRIEDRSRNGILVNGRRLRESKLASGDEVRIASYRLSFGTAPDQPDSRGEDTAGTADRTPFGDARSLDGTQVRAASAAPEGLGEMLGSSEPMQRVYEQVRRLAVRTEPVLVLGETGTGKELVARALHHLGPARSGPLVVVNCASIAPELVESELFGHEKGAFTGASQRRLGAFLSAQGGTLFLDEIGDMPRSLQPRLLRVLETGEVVPVGSDRPLKTTARLVAATHRDLKKEIAAGRFRQDLYYRLRVAPISLPPLRDRGDDAVLLARTFLAEGAAARPIELAPDAVAFLRAYAWPGNVRELRNLARRLAAEDAPSPVSAATLERMVEADRLLDVESLDWISAHSSASGFPSTPPAGRQAPGPQAPLRDLRHDLEGRVVEHTLRACGWNISRSAKMLGVARGTLYKLIELHRLDRSR